MREKTRSMRQLYKKRKKKMNVTCNHSTRSNSNASIWTNHQIARAHQFGDVCMFVWRCFFFLFVFSLLITVLLTVGIHKTLNVNMKSLWNAIAGEKVMCFVFGLRNRYADRVRHPFKLQLKQSRHIKIEDNNSNNNTKRQCLRSNICCMFECLCDIFGQFLQPRRSSDFRNRDPLSITKRERNQSQRAHQQ